MSDTTDVEKRSPKIILIGMDPGLSTKMVRCLADSYKEIGNIKILDYSKDLPQNLATWQDYHIDDYDNRDCKNDHGERTNYKLKDQPFYIRGRNGKMRGY